MDKLLTYCSGGDCPLQDSCKRYYPHFAKEFKMFYITPPYFNNQCEFHEPKGEEDVRTEQ